MSSNAESDVGLDSSTSTASDDYLDMGRLGLCGNLEEHYVEISVEDFMDRLVNGPNPTETAKAAFEAIEFDGDAFDEYGSAMFKDSVSVPSRVAPRASLNITAGVRCDPVCFGRTSTQRPRCEGHGARAYSA